MSALAFSRPILESAIASRLVGSSIWVVGILLQSVILIRGMVAKLFRKYPFFYGNITCGLIVDVLFYIWQPHAPQLYATRYWDAQFLTTLTGCGIILEVLRGTVSIFFRSKPVTNMVYTYVVLICMWLAVAYLGARNSHQGLHNIILERNFRTAQALALLGLAGAVCYFRVPVGKNLKGLFVGYGLYVGVSLVILSVRFYREPSFSSVLAMVQPFFYVVALLIWTIALWTYHPDPAPEPGSQFVRRSNSLKPQPKRSNNPIRFGFTKAVGS